MRHDPNLPIQGHAEQHVSHTLRCHRVSQSTGLVGPRPSPPGALRRLSCARWAWQHSQGNRAPEGHALWAVLFPDKPVLHFQLTITSPFTHLDVTSAPPQALVRFFHWAQAEVNIPTAWGLNRGRAHPKLKIQVTCFPAQTCLSPKSRHFFNHSYYEIKD